MSSLRLVTSHSAVCSAEALRPAVTLPGAMQAAPPNAPSCEPRYSVPPTSLPISGSALHHVCMVGHRTCFDDLGVVRSILSELEGGLSPTVSF